MVARTAEKRPLGALGRIAVVAAMHVAVLFVIARSLGLVPIEEPVVTTGTLIDERTPPPPPPRVDPTFDHDSGVVLPMPAPVPFPEDTSTDTIGAEFRDPGDIPVTSGSADPQPVLVNVRQDARYPLTQPPYNPRDIREGNQGSVDVEVYVLPNGRVGDARILRGTGFERLDRATIEEAKRNWRLAPATRDGVAIAQWYRLRVVFKLKNQ